MLVTGAIVAALLAAPAVTAEASWGAAACDLLQGTADAQAAPLMAPTFFASAGFINAGETSGAPALPDQTPAGRGPTYRVLAGASYSLSRLSQGRALQGHAEVACRREQVRLGLEAALAVSDVLGAERALTARAAVLESALPRSEEMMAGLGAAVQEVRATVDALDADRLRLQDLRALARETSLALGRASRVAHPALAEVPTLMAEYQALDHELGLADVRSRDAGTWDISVRGGYDQVFDGRDRVPLFAMLSVSFDLGRLWRGSANTRALAGRDRAERESPDALVARVTRLLDAQRATLAAERARLRSAGTLLAALDGQMAEVERLETVRVERYRHALWFELVRLRAEHAYLAARVEDLARALGEEAR
jgi:hypothetical protein